VDWDLFLSGESGPEVLGRTELGAMGRDAIARRLGEVDARARTGFAYRYLGYPMITAYLTGRDPGHLLHTVLEFMNSPEVLEFTRAVTAEPTVIKADAQATYYRPGDYLTLHDDTGVGERRAAYTLGFTRRWRSDWGGQLLFHAPDGEIIRGLQPGFNVLTLFRTPQWHSVAPVAPYAGARRLSITGWLRDDPKT
jgi:SM-20-related protein